MRTFQLTLPLDEKRLEATTLLRTLNLALERNKERIARLVPFGVLDDGRKEMANSRSLLPERLVTPCIL